MGTKNKPGKFDCYANAEPDEPMFVLLGRDVSASGLVWTWARKRELEIDRGRKPESDRAMVQEARNCAAAMEAFHAKRSASK